MRILFLRKEKDMLELRKIKKDYPAGNGVVHALKGVDITFRSSEFVSILGPSGCGKTTLLNIIGGLDQYTDGDLFINRRSTKSFKDRDWDTYRNHSVGFVFQSYNLIPHQSVLQNVEIALTLSGVRKSERKARAKQALIDVGLGDQLNKKPSEMSGGQMQRVAIARALVNNPDIILADEPTGALDTETSVQVMEILKEVSKDRLVVMVTHNPELADRYSSRIINMLDGEITHDSMPLTEEEYKTEKQKAEKANSENKKTKKPSMSFATSFMLSLKNLFTKKGRTILTSFAGSIGIIGIALILSVSQGTTNYINSVQEEALASYPLTLEATTVEMSNLIQAFLNVDQEGETHEKDGVYKKAALENMIKAMQSIEETKNDLKSFKIYLDRETADPDSKLGNAINGVQYAYNLDLQVYTKNVDGDIIRSDLEEVITNLMVKYLNVDMSSMSAMTSMSPLGSSSEMKIGGKGIWQEILPGKDGSPVNDLIKDQYEIEGEWPNEYDEIVLIVDKNNELGDVVLYTLGLLSAEDIDNLAQASLNGAQLNNKVYKWTFDDIRNMEFKTVLNADCYRYDAETGLYVDRRNSADELRYLYDNGLSLKVTGIIRPKEDSNNTMLSGGIGYTYGLTEYLIEKAADAPVIKAQLDSPDIDVITGLPFDPTKGSLTSERKVNFVKDYVATIGEAKKAELFTEIACLPSEEYIAEKLAEKSKGLTRTDMENAMADVIALRMNTTKEDALKYLASMNSNEITNTFNAIQTANIKGEYAAEQMKALASKTPAQLAEEFDKAFPSYTNEHLARYYDEVFLTHIKATNFINYVSSLDTNGKAEVFIAMNCIPSEEEISRRLAEKMSLFPNREAIEATLAPIFASKMNVSEEEVAAYLGKMSDAELTAALSAILTEQVASEYAAEKMAELSMLPPEQAAATLDAVLASLTNSQIANLYDVLMEFSDSTYDENLVAMGYLDLDSPAKINIYASSFENKDVIVAAIKDYNNSVDELRQIKYTDLLGIMMSSITTIINAITYVLIAFVAISLVVSSIMIGVITLISVQERTKEIGILRAIGASKRDVSSMFNAETIIVGFASGLLGVVVTYLLCIPINAILLHFTGLTNLRAVLPFNAALILIAISVLLTLIAGIIPSRSASKKDPVVALRTE